MAHFLCSQRFNNQEKVEASVSEFFASKDKNCYQRGIKNSETIRLQTVEPDDLYCKC